jgi:hypothetical protein
MIGDRNGVEPDWRADITREADARCRGLPDLYQMMETDRAFFVSFWGDEPAAIVKRIDQCEKAGCKVLGHLGWSHPAVGAVTVVIFGTAGSADRMMARIAQASREEV